MISINEAICRLVRIQEGSDWDLWIYLIRERDLVWIGDTSKTHADWMSRSGNSRSVKIDPKISAMMRDVNNMTSSEFQKTYKVPRGEAIDKIRQDRGIRNILLLRLDKEYHLSVKSVNPKMDRKQVKASYDAIYTLVARKEISKDYRGAIVIDADPIIRVKGLKGLGYQERSDA